MSNSNLDPERKQSQNPFLHTSFRNQNSTFQGTNFLEHTSNPSVSSLIRSIKQSQDFGNTNETEVIENQVQTNIEPFSNAKSTK